MRLGGEAGPGPARWKPMAAPDTTSKRERFEIPWDLSSWAERGRVLDWVIQDVESLDWDNPELLSFLRANPAFQPRLLLVLITYAYALGLCESEEVVQLYYTDAGLKAKFPAQNPTASAVTRFRRDHRGLLKWGLAQCFKRALRHRYALGEIPIPPGLRRALDEAAAGRLELARHVDRSVQAE